MKRSIEVVYDGETLRPQEPLDLKRDARYRITIEDVPEPEETAGGVFDDILAMAQDLGIPDLAEQHDHYLYGTPKR